MDSSCATKAVQAGGECKHIVQDWSGPVLRLITGPEETAIVSDRMRSGSPHGTALLALSPGGCLINQGAR